MFTGDYCKVVKRSESDVFWETKSRRVWIRMQVCSCDSRGGKKGPKFLISSQPCSWWRLRLGLNKINASGWKKKLLYRRTTSRFGVHHYKEMQPGKMTLHLKQQQPIKHNETVAITKLTKWQLQRAYRGTRLSQSPHFHSKVNSPGLKKKRKKKGGEPGSQQPKGLQPQKAIVAS